jgi:hypothetical protein
MYELIYNSVATNEKIGEADLQRILAGARKKNSELGITGVLLYHRGEFVQLLEGSRESVLHVYNDIIFLDHRHTALVIGWEGAIERRRFSDWTMGYTPVDALDHAKTPGLEDFLRDGAAALDFTGPEHAGPRLLYSIYAQLCKTA